MTPETARLLAQALRHRRAAEDGLVVLLARIDVETPEAVAQSMKVLGETYVHEDRIINRIVFEEVDE